MDLALQDSSQPWPQVFRQFIVTNSRHWLNCAREDIDRLWHERSQVLKGLSYALSLPEAWPLARELMLYLSPPMVRQGLAVEWERFLTRAIARSLEEKDPVVIDFRLQLGILYRLQGRLPEAQHCFKEALNLCGQYNSSTHYWTLLNQLGLAARLSAQPEQALAYCRQVLVEQNLPVSEHAEALNVMGLVAYDRRQWEKALNYFEQALTRYRLLDDSYEIARILNNRGLVLLRNGRWDEAEASYREAIRQFQVSGDETERFKSLMNLGNIFLMRQDYKTAIRQYQVALPVFQKCNFLVDLAHTYNNLGMAHAGLADWKVAEAYFLASLELWRNLEDTHNLANVLDNLGNMFIKARQLKQANELLNQALQVLSTTPDNPAKTYLQREIKNRLSRIKDKTVGPNGPTAGQ